MTPRFRTWAVGAFVAVSLVLMAFPVGTQLRGGTNKDYRLWYAVGRWVVGGEELYERSDFGEPFPFLYPPFAAVLLAPPSLLGPLGCVVALSLVTIASWYAAIRLSVRLTAGSGPVHWSLWGMPSLLCLWGVYDMAILGQPNLLLLALMLAGFLRLRRGGEVSAGLLFALAAAIKAFPVVVVCYLVWRRHWAATLSLAVGLVAFSVLVPAPVRGFGRNLGDLTTWLDGMLLSQRNEGFSPRPEQALGWKNQSVLGVGHRWLRAIDADGDTFEPHDPVYVNFVTLDYPTATLVIAGFAGAIGLGFILAMPRRANRTAATTTLETAALTALMIIASPISYTYYDVWLIYPVTVLLHHAVTSPERLTRRVSWVTLVGTLLILLAGLPLGRPHVVQAYGHGLWAILFLVAGLGWLMQRAAGPPAVVAVPGTAAARATESVAAVAL